MNSIKLIFTNKYLYIPFFLWLIIQSYKVLWELIKTKKFNIKRIIGAGGMPSSHSAVVVSLSTLIGRYQGLDSPIFALSLIFAIVVMYDSAGVRRAAGEQATVINKIVQTPELTGVKVQEKLLEALGHTPLQVFIGAIIGLITGLIF